MRGIKPGFFLNEQLADLSPLARLLFIGLWMLADREGRLEDRPRRIRAAVFPYEPDMDMDALLGELLTAAFIERYEVDGQSYLWIPTFARNQNINAHEADSTLPPSPHVHADASISSRARADRNGMEGKEKEKEKGSASARTDAPEALSLFSKAFETECGYAPLNPDERKAWHEGCVGLLSAGETPQRVPALHQQYVALFGPNIPFHPAACWRNHGKLTGASNGAHPEQAAALRRATEETERAERAAAKARLVRESRGR